MQLDGFNSMPQYNNTFGVIESWNDSLKRWKVRMDLDDSVKQLDGEKNITNVTTKSTLHPGTTTKSTMGVVGPG